MTSLLTTLLLLCCLAPAGDAPPGSDDDGCGWIAAEAEVASTQVLPGDGLDGPPRRQRPGAPSMPTGTAAEAPLRPADPDRWGLPSRLLRRLLDPVVLLL